MPVANAIAAVATIMFAAVGGVLWSALSGLPWYMTVPVTMAAMLVLALMTAVAHTTPTLIAFKAFRIARAVRALEHRTSYVPGFILPVGFWRLLTNREEYVLALLVCDEAGSSSWRSVLRMTRGQRLYEMFGWDAEAICRYAVRQDDPRAVIVEAKELAQEHPPIEVMRYAGHPAGAKRGFEFLRNGIPYEFGEVLV